VAQKTTLRVSAAVAAYVRPDTARGERLKAARGQVPFRTPDLGTVLFLLSRDQDPDVRSSAVRTLRDQPENILIALAAASETHPLLLDMLARLHFTNAKLVETIRAHTELDMRTRQFLEERAGAVPAAEPAESGPDNVDADECPEGEDLSEEEIEAMQAGDEIQEEEEHFSKYKLLQNMPINEKIKMAMTGDKEWRWLLIKETNKLVSTAVIKNPRITEAEVLAIAKSSELNEEVIRLVCMNKEWIKLYPVRKALVENNKTPLPRALRFLTTLNEKDLAALAKSKNISSVIARQAQRQLLNKKKS
jgi:hypothetical protein